MKSFNQYINEMREYDELKEKDKEQLIKQDPYNIRYLTYPSIELQKLAASLNGLVLQFLPRCPIEVQKIAVLQNKDAIEYIDNPSEELLELLKK